MLIRIRRSKDLLLQFQSFECSLFASNSCVYCTTRYSKCGRIGTKWLFFFTFIEKCCVVIEKNIDKKLANRISHQIWYKRCLKGKFGRGVQICEGGSISASGFGPGDPDPRGSKSNFSFWISASNFKCLFYNYARERPEICNDGLLDNYTQNSHQWTI